jgi:hypothetical protein
VTGIIDLLILMGPKTMLQCAVTSKTGDIEEMHVPDSHDLQGAKKISNILKTPPPRRGCIERVASDVEEDSMNLSDNQMGEPGTDGLAGVLVQCAAMAHRDLRINQIGAVGGGRLGA